MHFSRGKAQKSLKKLLYKKSNFTQKNLRVEIFARNVSYTFLVGFLKEMLGTPPVLLVNITLFWSRTPKNHMFCEQDVTILVVDLGVSFGVPHATDGLLAFICELENTIKASVAP